MACEGMHGCTRDQHDGISGWMSGALRVAPEVPRSCEETSRSPLEGDEEWGGP